MRFLHVKTYVLSITGLRSESASSVQTPKLAWSQPAPPQARESADWDSYRPHQPPLEKNSFITDANAAALIEASPRTAAFVPRPCIAGCKTIGRTFCRTLSGTCFLKSSHRSTFPPAKRFGPIFLCVGSASFPYDLTLSLSIPFGL